MFIIVFIVFIIPSTLNECPCNTIIFYLPPNCKQHIEATKSDNNEDNLCEAEITFTSGIYDIRNTDTNISIAFKLYPPYVSKFSIFYDGSNKSMDYIMKMIKLKIPSNESFVRFNKKENYYYYNSIKIKRFNTVLYEKRIAETHYILYLSDSEYWPYDDNEKYLDLWTDEHINIRMKAFKPKYIAIKSNSLPIFHLRYLRCCYKNYGGEHFNFFIIREKDYIDFYAQPLKKYYEYYTLMIVMRFRKLLIKIICSSKDNIIYGEMVYEKFVHFNAIIEFLNTSKIYYNHIHSILKCVWRLPHTVTTKLGKINLAQDNFTLYLYENDENLHYENITVVYNKSENINDTKSQNMKDLLKYKFRKHSIATINLFLILIPIVAFIVFFASVFVFTRAYNKFAMQQSQLYPIT